MLLPWETIASVCLIVMLLMPYLVIPLSNNEWLPSSALVSSRLREGWWGDGAGDRFTGGAPPTLFGGDVLIGTLKAMLRLTVSA
jgi:hypothetical protein